MYNFQIAVDVVIHEAIDPAVITQPPVVLTSQMVAAPLNDVNRQLLNFIEVYEHNGSDLVLQTLFPYN